MPQVERNESKRHSTEGASGGKMIEISKSNRQYRASPRSRRDTRSAQEVGSRSYIGVMSLRSKWLMRMLERLISCNSLSFSTADTYLAGETYPVDNPAAVKKGQTLYEMRKGLDYPGCKVNVISETYLNQWCYIIECLTSILEVGVVRTITPAECGIIRSHHNTFVESFTVAL